MPINDDTVSSSVSVAKAGVGMQLPPSISNLFRRGAGDEGAALLAAARKQAGARVQYAKQNGLRVSGDALKLSPAVIEQGAAAQAEELDRLSKRVLNQAVRQQIGGAYQAGIRLSRDPSAPSKFRKFLENRLENKKNVMEKHEGIKGIFAGLTDDEKGRMERLSRLVFRVEAEAPEAVGRPQLEVMMNPDRKHMEIWSNGSNTYEITRAALNNAKRENAPYMTALQIAHDRGNTNFGMDLVDRAKKRLRRGFDADANTPLRPAKPKDWIKQEVEALIETHTNRVQRKADAVAKADALRLMSLAGFKPEDVYKLAQGDVNIGYGTASNRLSGDEVFNQARRVIDREQLSEVALSAQQRVGEAQIYGAPLTDGISIWAGVNPVVLTTGPETQSRTIKERLSRVRNMIQTNRYGPDRIHGILQEAKQGRPVQDILQSYNLHPKTFHDWQAKFGQH